MSYLIDIDSGTPLWVCDRCRHARSYLSESWHQLYIPTFENPEQILHYCLECMTDKQEWRADAV